jgi:phosphatidylserine decarboxylase
MLAHEAPASRFIGGTIYQAFLSSVSYHRWHAPVSGRVVKIKVIPRLMARITQCRLPTIWIRSLRNTSLKLITLFEASWL